MSPSRIAPLSYRRSLLALALGGALTSGLSACSLPTRLPAVPRERRSGATVLGLPNERFYPTHAAGQAALQQEFIAAVERRLVSRGLPPDVPALELELLGISGGGENGAFGAGLLNGWTERGDRPEFFLVTGISTGALSAPFAFPGCQPEKRLYGYHAGGRTGAAEPDCGDLGRRACRQQAPLPDHFPLPRRGNVGRHSARL